MTRPSGLLCLAALLALTACPAKTDYGQTCKMTKPKGASACLVDIPNNNNICGIGVSEMTTASFDYVSLGNAECDDQVCLRTAIACTTEADCPNSQPCGASGYCSYADETNGNAVGYCTRSCLDNTDCQPDFQGGKDLVCTQLLFSEEYLSQLKANCDTDSNCLYNQIFGSGVSANYCLKPRSKTQ